MFFSQGCKRSKVNLSGILTSQWTNVTNGWKWQAGISVDFPGLLNIPRYKCLGVLVDEQFVLTPGHCLRLGYIRVNPSKTLLSFGSYKHGFRKAKLNVRAKSIHFHQTLDLALVRLEKPIKDSPDIQPVCLPLQDHVDLSIGQKLVTVTWPSRGWEYFVFCLLFCFSLRDSIKCSIRKYFIICLTWIEFFFYLQLMPLWLDNWKISWLVKAASWSP